LVDVRFHESILAFRAMPPRQYGLRLFCGQDSARHAARRSRDVDPDSQPIRAPSLVATCARAANGHAIAVPRTQKLSSSNVDCHRAPVGFMVCTITKTTGPVSAGCGVARHGKDAAGDRFGASAGILLTLRDLSFCPRTDIPLARRQFPLVPKADKVRCVKKSIR
jgi:hypothetical protein